MVRACKKRNKRISKVTILALISSIFAVFSAVLFAFPNETAISCASGSSAILIEKSSGRVLFAENENTPLPIASTTKILTALTVIENVSDLDKEFVIPKEAVGIEGSSIYLKEGETLTVRELLYGLMLRSGNDSAVALAIATSGSVADFVSLMNETAKKYGAVNSNFTNPHGLHDDAHLCTAWDLAKITAAAYNYPDFVEISSTKLVKISGEPERYLSNKNKMLTMYGGANGVKTGFTKKAGRCLVSAAVRDGMQLIAVVINHGDMWNDSIGMLDYGFNNYRMYKLFDDSQLMTVPVEKGKYPLAQIQSSKSFEYPLTAEEYKRVNVTLKTENSLTAPVKKGTIAGNIFVELDNRLLFSDNLYTISEVEKKGIF